MSANIAFGLFLMTSILMAACFIYFFRLGTCPEDIVPERYIDVEVKSRGLLGIKMVWEWMGQVGRENWNW